MIELIGLLGGACFAFSGVPTCIQTLKYGKDIGIPIQTAWSVFIGAWLSIIYLTTKNGFDWVISVDYLMTILTWGIVLRYHYFPREDKCTCDLIYIDYNNEFLGKCTCGYFERGLF